MPGTLNSSEAILIPLLGGDYWQFQEAVVGGKMSRLRDRSCTDSISKFRLVIFQRSSLMLLLGSYCSKRMAMGACALLPPMVNTWLLAVISAHRAQVQSTSSS